MTRLMVALFVLTTLAVSGVLAAPIATVQRASNATYKPNGATSFNVLRNRMLLDAGAVVRTGAKGRVDLLLSDGSQLRLGANSVLEVTGRTAVRDKQSFFRALGGEVYARLKPGSAARTRTAVAGVRGTYILLQVNEADGTTVLTVLEGSVDFYNEFGEVIVHESQQSTIAPGQGPTAPIPAPDRRPPAPPGTGQTLTGEGGLVLNPTGIGMAPGTISISPTHVELGEEEEDEEPTRILPPPPISEAAIAPAVLALASAGTGNGAGGRFHYSGVPLAARLGDHFEISGGVSRLRVSGGASDGLTKTGINLGIKYLINPNAREGDIQFAVGAGYDRALLKNIRAYGVASKAFRVWEDRAPIVGHLGVRYDRFDLDDIGGPKSDRVSIFAGTEIPITRDGAFALTGEIQSKNNDFNEAEIPFSIGARYRPPGGGFTISAGYQRQGLISDAGFYAQVGFSF